MRLLRTGVLAVFVASTPAIEPVRTAPADGATPPADTLSSDDRSSIRAAYEREHHGVSAVHDVPGTFRARTFSQQWTVEFDGRSVLVTPDTPGWTWGLQLTRFGIEGAEK